MANLPVPYTGLLPNRVVRAAGKQVKAINAQAAVATAAEEAKVTAIENVTESALLATAHLSALEGYLVGRVPHAEARLRHVADGGCMAMSNVVMKLAK